MKIFAKIFLFFIITICFSLSLSGYLLISNSFQNAINREVKQAVNQYQVTKFALQANIFTEDENISGNIDFSKAVAQYQNLNNKNIIFVFSNDGQKLFSTSEANIGESLLDNIKPDRLIYNIEEDHDKYILFVAGYLTQDGIRMVVGIDISTIITEHNRMQEVYKIVYFTVCLVSLLCVLIFSLLFVSPIKKMTKLANRISEGDYSSRISVSTDDELGELADSFNKMADAVENSVDELTTTANQKEEFVANFTHELKTPLTSVIGYADMIYQKDLTREQIKNAAKYILDEGMRLESLSLKLMDLIVLNSQEIDFEILEADAMLNDILETTRPLTEKDNISVSLQAEKAYISVEYDLFKTMVINLIDNARKAQATEIKIFAKAVNDNYSIQIADNGCGISQENIKNITEAFFMVDKSRSRKQHGAGIGLALVKKIVTLHMGELSFESELGKGTTVNIIIPTKGGI